MRLSVPMVLPCRVHGRGPANDRASHGCNGTDGEVVLIKDDKGDLKWLDVKSLDK